jgi:membrane fusion protein (multidrug efflux system)
MKSDSHPSNRKKKSGIVYIPLTAIVIIVLIGGIYWYNDYTKYISTDDAQVEGDNISVSSKIMGRIGAVYAEEGDTVSKGLLLVSLDSTDLVAQKLQIIATRDQTIAMKKQTEAKYSADKESIHVLRINLEKTQNDFERAQKQYDGNVITAEQSDHIQKSYESAKAQLEASTAQLSVSKAQIASAIAAIKSAEAQIRVIESQLANTKLFAPMDAFVAKKWLFTGEIVQPGQAILTLNDKNVHWISVYLEETKLAGVHLKQKAHFTIDAYPNITFTGHIFYIGSNTASQFSLIPPNNASGNFTKITQRVVLKISIDSNEEGVNMAIIRLLPGMSAVVKIIKD